MALNLKDWSPNGNDLTNHGAAEYTTNFPFVASTEAIDFTAASSQYLDATLSATLKPTGKFTVEFWIKTAVSGVKSIIQSWSTNVNAAGWLIELENTTGQIRFFLGKNTGTVSDTDYKLLVSTAQVNDNAWHHVACVYDQTNVYIYIDGALDTSAAWTSNPVYDTTPFFRIGCGNAAGTNQSFFSGTLDDIRIWGTDRTQTQINNNKSLELVGNEANLNAYWPLESLSSPSASRSPSASISPSASRSPSSSNSPSISPSASRSPSSSISSSVSASQSPSASISSSPSPSAGPHPFLQRVDGQYQENGVRVRGMYVNHYPLILGMSQPDVAAFFQACQNAGIRMVRTWCFDSGKPPTNSPGNFRYLVYPLGTNVITNGSFETNTAGWVLDAAWSRSTADAEDGTASLYHNNDYNTYDGGRYNATVAANTDYVLTFWYKLQHFGGSSSQLPDLLTIGTSQGGSEIADLGFNEDTSGAWIQKQVSFNSGANTSIWINITNFGGKNIAFYDNFNLSKSQQLGNNLIPNPSFESNLNGWSSDADFTRSNDTAQSGSYSLKQVSAGGFLNFTTLNDATGILIQPDSVYLFEVYVKVHVNSGFGPVLYLNTGTAYGTTIYSTVLDDTGGAWQKISHKFVSGSATKFYVRLQNNDGNVVCYYDAFSLKKVAMPSLVYREDQFKQVDMVLNEASKYNVKLQLSFADNNTDYDTKATYVYWANQIYYQQLSDANLNFAFFSNYYCKKILKDFLYTFLHRQNTINGRIYKDDATIGVLEEGNELRSGGGGDISSPGGWIDEISTYIKSIDSNHLVSFGDCGHAFDYSENDVVYNGSYYGVDYKKIAALPNIDVLGFHLYTNQNNADGFGFGLGGGTIWGWGIFLGYPALEPNVYGYEGLKAQLRDYVAVGKLYGKIVTCDELGLVREHIASNSGDDELVQYPRVNAFHTITHDFFEAGGDAVFLWHGEINDGGTYSINITGTWDGNTTNQNFDDRPLAALISQVNTYAISFSVSPSGSKSPSASLSPSASPSVGYSDYTRGSYKVLPTGKDDLLTMYSGQDETNVASRDGVFVGQLSAHRYMVHQFKTFIGDQDYCILEWEGKSSLAPDTSPVYLQVYNNLTHLWETFDTCNDQDADVSFELEAKISDVTNYSNIANIITCRIYQLAVLV